VTITSTPPQQGGPGHAAPLLGDPTPERHAFFALVARRWAWVRASRANLRRRSLNSSLTLLGVVCLGIVVQLLGVGRLQHARDQQVLYDQLRHDLANAITPIGPTDYDNRIVRMGAPLALLEIPKLHLREVVLQGTSSSVTSHGPGHRRDTVMPGQPGVSLVMGRAATYGGPFAHLDQLTKGDQIVVTTGQGVENFTVVGPRRAGDLTPALPSGGSRLTLMTADGPALVPTGVLRVDADLSGSTQPSVAPLSSASVSDAERAMGTDFSHVSTLILWLELLVVVSLFTVWSRARWGRRQTWLVATPVLLFLAVVVADHVAQMLPNLL
jgi:sortase A